ncbi:MAG TPA: OsmC family protein [Longimicrobiales bacterium]|nr:OsmC family protein [Longimicrobiales bacterium]
MSSSRVTLRWTDALVFEGGADGGPQIRLDSAGRAGPSPTQLLLLSLAGCMGVDVRMILEKSRVPVEALEVVVEGDRRDEPPRRFLAIRLTYRIRGPAPGDRDKLQRAVDLSRDKYCSVLHTLRPDLDLEIAIERI